MNFSASELSARAMYHWMVGLITPRPIAWVSTRSSAGHVNLAPFSFFNGVGAKPPCLMFCPANNDDGSPKDTLRNLTETGQFAVSIVNEAVVDAMNMTAGAFDHEVDEYDVAKIEKADCVTIDVPRVSDAIATFECELMQAIQLGTGPGGANLVIGHIRHLHVADGLVADGRLKLRDLKTVGRMGGPLYCRTNDLFDLARPSQD
ncbi:flavin reductase family protein [Crateriforma spongiae]|uniref:flavin reductase family protein n=1 Tax=Crateriforma spongiae TaxID=2724528 RepID=UPI0014483051|nr:flavin reductase family protein [Crateriforma spongiae]